MLKSIVTRCSRKELCSTSETVKFAVELNQVSVYYNGICALDNINLKVAKGDSLAVIGPNGGGKTTLLKVIMGLIKPSIGTVNVYDRPAVEGRSVIGYVPQFAAFNQTFPITVEETVLSGCLTGKEGLFFRFDTHQRDLAASVMQKLGILALKNRQVNELSGGQKQKTLIARALASQPKILVLDEPTANVDSAAREDIYALLSQLTGKLTIIVVTHDLLAISPFFKSVACLSTKLHYHGDAELNNEIVQQVYGCPVELIAHGVPHRVLEEHCEKEDGRDGESA